MNLHRPALVPTATAPLYLLSPVAAVKQRKLNLKARVERSTAHFSFKRLVPGGFNVGLIGSTCTALPRRPWWRWC
jgi:hypothetical protein